MTDRRALFVGLFGLDGLIAMVIGTFLPWLQSGETHRNVYRAGGALRRVVGVDGIEGFALRIAPYLAISCALVVVLYVLASARLAAGVGALLGAAAAAGSIGVLRADSVGAIHPESAGPVVTLCGAIVVIVAATLTLAPARTT